MITRALSEAELRTEAEQRFGSDLANWAFRCPRCGDVATGAEFEQALATVPNRAKVSARDLLGQVCIGRALGAGAMPTHEWAGRGCDQRAWAASANHAGPWDVTARDGRRTYYFELA
ncbi:VVA0879 family protein [Microtetraspora fusca]|uniref:VVA0879 family protein n=1 Tax=Microtetraspora fusca TaxID=1997 RepID=A0ABW6VF70_MICFU